MSGIPFRYFLRVRYGECDAQKVVFNARYGDYVDIAVAEFMRALGFGEALVDGSLDYQLVRQLTEWRASARYDDVVEVRVTTARIGTTSFTLACEFRQADADTVFATSETTYVHVDTRTLKKQTLSETLRAALQRGAPDQITDHAGYRAATKAP